MKSDLDVKSGRVTQRKNELDALERKLERDRIYLDRTNEYAVNSFNADVNRFNTMNDAAQSLIDDYNRDVNAFNAELERVGTLIR